MRKSIFTFFILSSMMLSAQEPVRINVNALKQTGTVKPTFNGTNIEDLNNQTNGGVFSQLIHGEAFEENIDIDFMGLPTTEYVRIHVMLDETRTPHLYLNILGSMAKWNNLSDKYDVNRSELLDSYYSARIPKTDENGKQIPPKPRKAAGMDFYGCYVIFDSIPAPYQKILLDRINGKEQISRYWTRIKSDAEAEFILKRGDAYMGRQDQIVRYVGGSGEAGLFNSGLDKQGIDLQAGKPYDGVLRVKSNSGPQQLWLSLRDSKGAILAEKAFSLKGDGTFEKVEFELTPSGSDAKGSFGVALKSKGEIELGFAFLQPGEWGRVNGYPLRKMLIDALKAEGITTMRYNGSMVDQGADAHLYRWKKMLGPVDKRKVCFRSGFNPYATHSFGIIEALEMAEVLGAQAMIGMSLNETPEDIRDFVEYVNGDVTTKWGALRAEQGHPAPFNLKHIEVDNERKISVGYVEAMKKFAEAAWSVDPEMNIVASLNIGLKLTSYGYGSEEYKLALDMYKWFIEKGHADQLGWDPHYYGFTSFAHEGNGKGFENMMGVILQENLLKDTGHKLTLYPMEENGSNCDWSRGMAHAHNWNTIQRYADCFTWCGTANTCQPHMLHYNWNQGRVHYTTNEVWFQPSAYEDQMMSENWFFNVLETSCSDENILDVLAKTNDDRSELKIYVLNLSKIPRTAVINVEGFKYKTSAQTWTLGGCDQNVLNTVDNKTAVAPQLGVTSFKRKDAEYTFPKYSYTVITLRK